MRQPNRKRQGRNGKRTDWITSWPPSVDESRHRALQRIRIAAVTSVWADLSVCLPQNGMRKNYLLPWRDALWIDHDPGRCLRNTGDDRIASDWRRLLSVTTGKEFCCVAPVTRRQHPQNAGLSWRPLAPPWWSGDKRPSGQSRSCWRRPWMFVAVLFQTQNS